MNAGPWGRKGHDEPQQREAATSELRAFKSLILRPDGLRDPVDRRCEQCTALSELRRRHITRTNLASGPSPYRIEPRVNPHGAIQPMAHRTSHL